MNSIYHVVLNGFDLHDLIMSYVLDPLIMSSLCSVSKKWDGCCLHEGSWQGTMVDVPPWFKPLGCAAWSHFRIWKQSKFIVVRPWMFQNSGLLLDASIRPWQWSTSRPILHGISVLRPSRILPGLQDSLWRRCRHKWFHIGTPTPIYDIPLRLHIYNHAVPDLRFGFANTNDVCELTAMVTNEKYGCGLLGRDPKLADIGELQYYYFAIRQGSARFCLNSRVLFEATCPQLRGSVVIKFGVVDSTLLFTVDDLKFQTPLPADGVGAADFHYPVLVIDGSGWPQDFGCLPFSEPLLCRNGCP